MTSVAAFERLFERDEDPWGFRTRWYEERKRSLTLASLPKRRYACGYEPGCANGELSAALATRCDRLLASDIAPTAVALATKRVAALAHVEVFEAHLPSDWPAVAFDLLVLSELGYYLAGDALSDLVQRARQSLAAGGTLLACHWRHPIPGCDRDGDEVHRLIDRELGMANLVHHAEPDFVLDVWSSDSRSVGAREGLVPGTPGT